MERVLGRASLWLIRLYQLTLSPLIGDVCRFVPSCSRYAAASIEKHGFFLGVLLSGVRLCKCHPLHPGGFDPPPLRFALRWRNCPAELGEPLRSPPSSPPSYSTHGS